MRYFVAFASGSATFSEYAIFSDLLHGLRFTWKVGRGLVSMPVTRISHRVTPVFPNIAYMLNLAGPLHRDVGFRIQCCKHIFGSA